jgi:DNA modification methylase
MISILEGDVRERLRDLADESVNCVVTSPPYWGLRDYGVKGQIGMEPTVFEHIELLVDVFREVRRVLRKDGTLWLNYGDAYSGSGKGGNPGPNGMQDRNKGSLGVRGIRRSPFKDKDRMLLPARLAIALQEDGWWIRDEIIWCKPNPMPSSVRDRTTPAHEMIYLLTKSARYAYDFQAMQEPASGTANARRAAHPTGWASHEGSHGTIHREGKENTRTKKMAAAGSGIKYNESFSAATSADVLTMRNKRSVWTVAPTALPEAHFATFPPKLIEPCILAGCPAGGTVLDPFFGAGTTGLVAEQHGRNCIGIELNPAYVLIATRRLGLGIFA